ncbi:hypothetical protein PR202_ga04626 [Eleusine coracana subsp. coracana]|uniref:Uncharacterized protein n=1 Tax=Eleusine coracana subsp. coracana TaxID=191504 RepID=A0AAV5BQU8_ELECO|nr:hypothetical protein PR202_ga04626 [Eleusine coracana subsp. coracana]
MDAARGAAFAAGGDLTEGEEEPPAAADGGEHLGLWDSVDCVFRSQRYALLLHSAQEPEVFAAVASNGLPVVPWLLLAALVAAAQYVLRLLHSFLWVPYRIERRLRRQGIGGPPRSLLSGNAADYRALLAAARSAPLASFHHSIIARATAPRRSTPNGRRGTAGRSCTGSGPARG